MDSSSAVEQCFGSPVIITSLLTHSWKNDLVCAQYLPFPKDEMENPIKQQITAKISKSRSLLRV